MNFGWLNQEHQMKFILALYSMIWSRARCIHEHQHPGHAIPWDKAAVYNYYQARLTIGRNNKLTAMY